MRNKDVQDRKGLKIEIKLVDEGFHILDPIISLHRVLTSNGKRIGQVIVDCGRPTKTGRPPPPGSFEANQGVNRTLHVNPVLITRTSSQSQSHPAFILRSISKAYGSLTAFSKTVWHIHAYFNRFRSMSYRCAACSSTVFRSTANRYLLSTSSCAAFSTCSR